MSYPSAVLAGCPRRTQVVGFRPIWFSRNLSAVKRDSKGIRIPMGS
jgi:hypothetical protein